MQRDGEAFALAVGMVEFAHQEVGIEEEDDERDFDDRATDVGEEATIFGVLGHGGRDNFPAECGCRPWSRLSL